MDTSIPSAQDVRDKLAPLIMRELELLAERSGVPFTTIYKIQRGETANPGIETVRAFYPLLPDLPDSGASHKRRHDDSV